MSVSSDLPLDLPVNFQDVLACEEVDYALSDILIDEDVEKRIDEAVQVSEDDHIPHPAARLPPHEEDGVGPPADEEGGGNCAHHECYPVESFVLTAMYCLNRSFLCYFSTHRLLPNLMNCMAMTTQMISMRMVGMMKEREADTQTQAS